MKEKKVIDYTRTYRRIEADKKKCVLYIVILLLLGFLLMWTQIDDLTRMICKICAGVLKKYVCWNPFRNVSSVWKNQLSQCRNRISGNTDKPYKCRNFSWSDHSAGGTSMEGSPSCYISDSVQCDSSDKQSMVCVWGKIFSVYFNRLFKIIYASGNWHMGDVFCYDSYGHRNNRRQGSDL